jgi:hypothetical protein
MGAAQSSAAGSALPRASALGGSSASSAAPAAGPSYTSSARENEFWLTANVARVLDDAYVAEWHRKNDLYAWMEKERKRAAQSSSSSGSSRSSSSRDSGSSSSSASDHSEFWELVWSYLGPHFSSLQSARLASIVHEIGAQCEGAAPGKSMAVKREAFVRRIHLAIEGQRQAMLKQKAQQAALMAPPSSTMATSPKALLAPLHRVITPEQQLEEVKKLPLSLQLSVRLLLSMLAQLKPDAAQSVDASAQAACSSLLLHQLLPLLDELAPVFITGLESASKLGLMEALEEFLVRAFKSRCCNGCFHCAGARFVLVIVLAVPPGAGHLIVAGARFVPRPPERVAARAASTFDFTRSRCFFQSS